ncbi:MAG TPA: hypothetical protein DHV26_09175 [Cytophagales bacterium]|nr:hypothetical protein [Cytophagales bacterium]HRG07945.1 hypothetical protein [Cyclobacteriaceae bacterium]
MKIIRLTRQIWACAMLPVVFVLVAFSTVQKTDAQYAAGKPVIQISQAATVTAREQAENIPVNPIRHHDFIETTWQLASFQLTTLIHKQKALRIPVHSFNVFYEVITIHAP